MPVPISHHPRGRRCYSLLLAGALALFSANPANAAPNTDPLPLEYAWGETYLEIAHELIAKKIELLEDQEGRLIRIQRSELDVRYLFYTEEKIGDIILMEREEEGERRMVLDRLVMEPARPAAAPVGIGCRRGSRPRHAANAPKRKPAIPRPLAWRVSSNFAIAIRLCGCFTKSRAGSGTPGG